jgi:hypothetical protein
MLNDPMRSIVNEHHQYLFGRRSCAIANLLATSLGFIESGKQYTLPVPRSLITPVPYCSAHVSLSLTMLSIMCTHFQASADFKTGTRMHRNAIQKYL